MAKPAWSRSALMPHGVRLKLILGFVLMSLVPLVMLMFVAAWFAFPWVREFYQLDRWFPVIANPAAAVWWVISLIALTVVVAILGSWYLVLRLIEPIIRLSQEARHVVAGDYAHPLKAEEPDEVGELTGSLNQLSARLRTQMQELERIAQQHAQLLERTKALALKDEATGAYTESYIRHQLAEELKRAATYQRPCAVALFRVPQLADHHRRHGAAQTQRMLHQVIQVIQDSVTDIDRVGTMPGQQIVVLLPERNKRHALAAAQAICARVREAFAGAADAADRILLIGEVAENPLDGVTADELLGKAVQRLHSAANPEGLWDDETITSQGGLA